MKSGNPLSVLLPKLDFATLAFPLGATGKGGGGGGGQRAISLNRDIHLFASN